MPLKLYRRHRQECEASFPEGAFSGEYEEGRRGVKRCSCIIHASGTLSGKFKRKQTGQFRWEEARAIAAQWETAGNWSGSIEPLSLPEAPRTEARRGASIADATEAYLARCGNRGIQPTTFNKYRTFIKQLREFCDTRGYRFIAQLTIADMDRFYASW